MTETLQSLLADAVARLTMAEIEGARLDAEVLLMHLFDIDRAHLYLRLQETATGDVESAYRALIDRRISGEPIAYITGHREFMGLDVLVDRRVLIPRPETEGLVERAVSWLSRHNEARHIVDVGTGSGAIAASIVQFVPRDRSLTVIGSDISRDALDVAAINLARLRASRTYLVQGSLLDWCVPSLDLIVANLPYLRDDQRHSGIAREPDSALYAAESGFALYSKLLTQAPERLKEAGAVMCEIDPDQRQMALATAAQAFPGAEIRVEPDLSGLDRYLIVERES